MGIRPRLSTPPQKEIPRSPVIPDDDEIGVLDFTRDNTPIRWKEVLTDLARDCANVYGFRHLGDSSGSQLWFNQVLETSLKQKPIDGLNGLKPTSLQELQYVFAYEKIRTREQLLVLCGRFLSRLVNGQSTVQQSLRGWYGKQKVNEHFWFSGLSVLSHSNWCGLNKNIAKTLEILDECHKLVVKFSGVASVELLELNKQEKGQGWDFSPLQMLLDYCQTHNLDWKGVLLDVLQRQRDARNREPTRTSKLEI